MSAAAVALFLLAFVISFAMTWLARRMAAQLHMIDLPGGRKKHAAATPRNGGIGIFWGIALPILLGLILVALMRAPPPGAAHLAPMAWFYEHLPGMKFDAPLAILLLATTFAMHCLGLVDDRRALGPWPKLICQFAIAAGLVFVGEHYQAGGFRVLTVLGNFPSTGFWISSIITVFWIVALTNAFNFLDNMDGLSAGVAFIAAALFLVAAFFAGQWFICGLLLVFMGSILGFLCFNFPPASIFMGDGGSLILGFFLSALTIRTTYVPPEQAAEKWYTVFMPLIVMAVPLYDLVIVSVLRIARGHSPMTGDTNHFSHRLVRHGFGRRGAVLVIYGVTLAMGISAPLLTRVDAVGAVLIGGQCCAMLVVLGVLERVGDHTEFLPKDGD